ncbi:MAG: eukaryotic-like serine/threonine-protein kinase, partial [Pseudonocardiales bacterium]|nr:eukaryotic-like serine/threonine-protein kinase [Pseudonocardiales bacterium]
MTTPRLLSERYELGEVLGYGGMSEVHRGLDTRLGRDVAVKVLRADLARDPQFQIRFRREAQNAAALNHPAIVAVYDTGEVAGESGPLPYIVMEYVDGQTLREIVKTSGPMTQQKVIEVMADVCAALDFSHRHNIIHRDVKPANIMINRAGAVKVMDFGIARALGEGQNVTQTAAVIGTAQYLSPEQARGEAVDARSDVYAAGCVLFELLTGDPPFTGDTPVAVAYQHVREDPRRPSEVNPSIPAALDAVVLKALSKNPLNRYQSAAEMRSDLVRVRSGQSPLAPLVMSEDERTAMLAASPSTGPTRRINGGRHTMPPQAVSDYDDYYDEQPRRSTAKTVGIVAAVLVALGLVGFVVLQVFFLSPPPTPKVAVPNVVGATEQDARNQVISAGLRVGTVQQVQSQASQIGQVLSTDPAVGTQIAKSSTVNLSVGNGPPTVAVPALAGMTVQDATTLLRERGLDIG